MLPRVFISVNDKSLQTQLKESLAASGAQIDCSGPANNPWQQIVQCCGDILIVSESMIPRPVESGIAILNNLPETPTTVIIHDFDSSEEHARLMAAGADVVLYSGVSLTSLVEAIETTLESRLQLVKLDLPERKKLEHPKLSDFISLSETMQMFINDVQKVAPSDSILLILGETGVGKEHLAKAIHAESSRSSGPFIALNTAALPEQLLESELFGHTRGSFTGATRSRRGAFEQAHGGTIFLDEIGEMPLHLQTKLLRVLQDYEVRPVGGDKSILVDVRVIAATNCDLENDILQGSFRKDLYYRLSVMALTIPPLRNRKEDIPSLTRRFMNFYRYKIAKDITRITKQTVQALHNYDWPGNVRELMNVIERAMLICKSNEITLQDLPSVFHNNISHDDQTNDTIKIVTSWKDKTLNEVCGEVLDQLEKYYIQMVLKETKGRIGKTADMAGIHSRGLYNKMKRLGIKKEDFK